MSASRIRGLTIFHCILFSLFLGASFTFWFPVKAARVFGVEKSDGPSGLLVFVLVLMILAAISEFFVNFGISVDHIWEFNSIDNFYDPAPCGQQRPLKSGILLKAQSGKMYKMMWVSTPILCNTTWTQLTSVFAFLYRFLGASSTSLQICSCSVASYG